MMEQVVPCLLLELLVAESPTSVGGKSGYEEAVLPEFPCLLLVLAVVVEPCLVELGVFHHRLQLVHQFEAAHDGHEVVGGLEGVDVGGDDARGRVVAEGKGTLEEAVGQGSDGGKASE